MSYELHLFGGFDLLGPDGKQIEDVQAHSKGAGLLVYLATGSSGEAVSREELLPILWPERPEEQARNALRITLSRLRERLPTGMVGGKGKERLWLDGTSVEVDVRRFEWAVENGRYREALKFYKGPFLDHVQLSDAGPFRRWVDEQRGTFQRQAYQAALSVAEAARQTGEIEEAEAAYRRALDLAPLKEEAAAGLIRVLAAQGKRSDAVKFLKSFQERLQAELDLSPSSNLQELAERIRAGPDEEGAPSQDVLEVAGGPTEKQKEPKQRLNDQAAESFRYSGVRGVIAGLIILTLVGTGVWYLLQTPAESNEGQAGSRTVPTVAVLPFTDLGRTGEGDPLLRGLHADVLTRLSNVSGLSVVSRTSVEPYRDRDLSLSAIADSLNARWVVEGGVQQIGNELQVNAQLIDPTTDSHTWAESYRRELSAENLFAIQANLAKRIARALEAELTSDEEGRLSRRPTKDLEAYRLAVEGRGLVRQRTDSTLRRGATVFRRAIERDSSFALAWVGLADALSFQAGHYGNAEPDSVLPPARDAVHRALELSPDLAEARATLGRIHFWRRRGPAALRELSRAVELGPSYGPAYEHLGMAQLTLGRPMKGLANIRQSVALNPLAPENRVALAFAYLSTGDYEKALRHAQRARGIQPNMGIAAETWALYHLGRLAEADTVLRETIIVPFVLAEIQAGDSTRARNLLAKHGDDDASFGVGLLHAALGDQSEALDHFEGSIRQNTLSGGSMTIRVRYFYPELLGPLRRDPRYVDLIRKVNLMWGLNPDGSLPDGRG